MLWKTLILSSISVEIVHFYVFFNFFSIFSIFFNFFDFFDFFQFFSIFSYFSRFFFSFFFIFPIISTKNTISHTFYNHWPAQNLRPNSQAQYQDTALFRYLSVLYVCPPADFQLYLFQVSAWAGRTTRLFRVAALNKQFCYRTGIQEARGTPWHM